MWSWLEMITIGMLCPGKFDFPGSEYIRTLPKCAGGGRIAPFACNEAIEVVSVFYAPSHLDEFMNCPSGGSLVHPR